MSLTESLYRCALAAITGNHSLSIYVTGNDSKKFKQVCCKFSLLDRKQKNPNKNIKAIKN